MSDNVTLAFSAILQKRFSRRTVLGTAGLVGAGSLSSTIWGASPAEARETKQRSRFEAVAAQTTDDVVLPSGYAFDVLIRWGDSLFPDTPSIGGEDLRRGALQSPGAAQRQTRQFGANCDAIAYFPVSGNRSDQGILCVNNEYVLPELMFGGRRRIGVETAEELRLWNQKHPQAVDLMKAAHGVSILEAHRSQGAWRFEVGAARSRRITAETLCEITGPARGAALLRTKEDPAGTRVRGTIANCAGGKTPWGTYLTAEENIDDYFGAGREWLTAAEDPSTAEAHRRFALRDHSLYGWDHVDRRFDVRYEPREALRFGWIVEIDPADPTFVPRKRTALGRFAHEGANTKLSRDGRVAVYMGDDDLFEYVYKFVTRDKFSAGDPKANRDLLDEGTLYVARFDSDGTGEWLPLVHDEKGPLNRRAGFASQADVVIKARAAADLLGATPMDRPEDVEPCPTTGHVYIACTKNPKRNEASRYVEWSGRTIDVGIDAANPRPLNKYGHIIELTEDDAAAMRFRWNVLLLASDSRGSARASSMACPDNLGIDPLGRLWIVTDADDRNNGCFMCPTSGPERGALKQFMSAPVGAEVCGCEFTPDGTTLFLSIQHPGEGGTVDEPLSHWPDGNGLPPRAAVIAVRREDGTPV